MRPEALRGEFFRHLIAGTLGIGRHILGTLRAAEPDFEPGGVAFHRYEEQPVLLRSFMRQDPDSVFLSELEDESLEMFISLLLTGHAAGSLATRPEATCEQWVARLAEFGPGGEAALGSLLLVELGDEPGHAVRRVATYEGGLMDWVRQATPGFDPERDPERARDFARQRYRYAPGPQSEARVEQLLDHSGAARGREMMALIPRWESDPDPVLLAEAGHGAEWPQLLGRSALLMLEIPGADLEALQLGLPADRSLRLYFCARPEEITSLGDPFHPGFLVQFVEAPPRRLIREAHPVLGLQPAWDGPGWADRYEEEEELPHHVVTKFGGWPSWRQDSEVPSCRHCGQPMRFAFQFANTALADTLVGPDFVDMLFFCPDHHDVWAMVHQC